MTLLDIQDLVGLPYVHGARGPNAYDCWGVCIKIYARMNRELPDYHVSHLTHEQTKALILGYARDHAEWIDAPEDWCFVFDRRSGHIGLYYGGRVVHSARTLGVIVQRYSEFKMSRASTRLARWVP
jgi:cell wall-associated NlpC family hydrolase